jgi:hypothetical protein
MLYLSVVPRYDAQHSQPEWAHVDNSDSAPSTILAQPASCSESLVQLNVPLVIVRLKPSVHPARHSTKTLLVLSM